MEHEAGIEQVTEHRLGSGHGWGSRHKFGLGINSPLTPADPKSGSTLLMLHSHKSFCEHISHHIVCWHKLELEAVPSQPSP